MPDQELVDALLLIVDHLDALWDELRQIKNAATDLKEQPRFNNYWQTEEEARLGWMLLQIARHGHDQKVYSPFPADQIRKRMAALANIAEAHLARIQRRYATILETEEKLMEKPPKQLVARGGVDIGRPEGH